MSSDRVLRRTQNTTLNVCGPSNSEFKFLKPFYILKRTNEKDLKVCSDSRNLKSPGRSLERKAHLFACLGNWDYLNVRNFEHFVCICILVIKAY